MKRDNVTEETFTLTLAEGQGHTERQASIDSPGTDVMSYSPLNIVLSSDAKI